MRHERRASHPNHTHAKPAPEGARQDTGTVNRLSQQRQQGGGDGMRAVSSRRSRGAGSRPVGSRRGGYLQWEGYELCSMVNALATQCWA